MNNLRCVECKNNIALTEYDFVVRCEQCGSVFLIGDDKQVNKDNLLYCLHLLVNIELVKNTKYVLLSCIALFKAYTTDDVEEKELVSRIVDYLEKTYNKVLSEEEFNTLIHLIMIYLPLNEDIASFLTVLIDWYSKGDTTLLKHILDIQALALTDDMWKHIDDEIEQAKEEIPILHNKSQMWLLSGIIFTCLYWLAFMENCKSLSTLGLIVIVSGVFISFIMMIVGVFYLFKGEGNKIKLKSVEELKKISIELSATWQNSVNKAKEYRNKLFTNEQIYKVLQDNKNESEA